MTNSKYRGERKQRDTHKVMSKELWGGFAYIRRAIWKNTEKLYNKCWWRWFLSLLQVVGLEETRSRGWGWSRRRRGRLRRGDRRADDRGPVPGWGSAAWGWCPAAGGWAGANHLMGRRRGQGHLERERLRRDAGIAGQAEAGRHGWRRARRESGGEWRASRSGGRVRSEREAGSSTIGRVALLRRVRRRSRIAARHGQRVGISSGLEEVGSEHGVGDGPGQGESLALVLHAPVLEPDLDGGLLEAKLGGQLAAAGAGDVVLLEELLFKTGKLLTAEGSSVAADSWALLVVGITSAVVVAAGRSAGGCGSSRRADFYFSN